MGGFLNVFYKVVFTLARLIPYNNSSKQEKLVRLTLELRKLPPRSFKIWLVRDKCLVMRCPHSACYCWSQLTPTVQEDCLVWTREPVFVVLIEDNWNGNHRTSSRRN
jgi:hypothetical protein